jgi:hypothetical protein
MGSLATSRFWESELRLTQFRRTKARGQVRIVWFYRSDTVRSFAKYRTPILRSAITARITEHQNVRLPDQGGPSFAQPDFLGNVRSVTLLPNEAYQTRCAKKQSVFSSISWVSVCRSGEP